MVSIITTLLGIVLGLTLLALLVLLLMPGPVLKFASEQVYKALDVDNYNRQSPYTHFGFSPIHTELSQVELQVTGQIPEDLDGAYIRNGTNTQFATTRSRLHMFNGAGMLHQIQIGAGKARYSNTYIRTPRFNIERERGEEVYGEFGNIAGCGKPGLFSLLLELLKKRFGVIPNLPILESGSSTTAIQYHHGKLYCLQETGYPFALNIKTDDGRLQLDGTGDWDTFDGILDGPFTAHPKIDPVNGDLYTYSTQLSNGKVRYATIKNGKMDNYVELYSTKPALGFLHDYYLTENHSVFPDVSLRFSPKEFMGEHKSPMYFDPQYKLRFGVIKRDHKAGDSIQWFTTKQAGHLWHTINGWEEKRDDGGTDIVIYAPVFRSYPANIPIHNPQEPHATLHIFRLNLDTGEVTDERQLLERFYERPSFNTQYLGQKNRYAYLLDEEKEGIMGKGVLKYDLLNETAVKNFDYGEAYGGEALFVPKPGATAEDEGYLIDILMQAEKAEAVIIDAQSMQELARIQLPQRVPFGVHGCWLDKQKLKELQEANQ